jgi:hypothetical protein
MERRRLLYSQLTSKKPTCFNFPSNAGLSDIAPRRGS